MKEIKFKLFILVCAIMVVISAGVLHWTSYQSGIREGVIAQEKPTSEPVARTKSEPVKIISEDENDFIEVTDRLSFLELPEAGILHDPDLTVGVTGAEWASYVPITKFIIEDDEGEEIGVLDWSTGKLEFSGKMSSSARSFFKYFLKLYVDGYIAGLSYEEAIELKQEFPIVGSTFIFRDMMWPITQSLAIDRFIEWLYENDYKIVKKEDK